MNDATRTKDDTIISSAELAKHLAPIKPDINTAAMADQVSRTKSQSPNGQPFVVTELLKKGKLYGERYAIYGDNYHRFGPILSLLMDTQTINCKDTHEMARLGVLVQIVGKITRYCENFNRGGHDDSLDDIAVYAMMLKELDQK